MALKAKKPKRVNLNKEVYVVSNEKGIITKLLCDYCAEEDPNLQQWLKNYNCILTKRLLTQKEKARIRQPFIGFLVDICGF